MAAIFRQNDVFRQRAGKLSRLAKKKLIPAGVPSPSLALIATTAGEQRIDGHALAGMKPPDFRAHLEHRACAFVAQDERVVDNCRTDAARQVVVHVRAAYSYRFNAHQNITRPVDAWFGQVADFDPARRGQKRCLHGCISLNPRSVGQRPDLGREVMAAYLHFEPLGLALRTGGSKTIETAVVDEVALQRIVPNLGTLSAAGFKDRPAVNYGKTLPIGRPQLAFARDSPAFCGCSSAGLDASGRS